MHGILLPTLYTLCGISLYAAMHHGFFALRRPVERMHLLFALLCLSVAVYVAAKAYGYQVVTPQQLVEARRWENAAACVLFVALAWFVTRATGMGRRWPVMALTAFWAAVLLVDLRLPYGLSYAEMPRLGHIDLPWGERVPDLRASQPTRWFQLGWAGILLVMAYCLYACLQQYRRGRKNRARAMAVGLVVFFAFILFNAGVNRGAIGFIHIAELGFVALIATMSLALTRSLRDHEMRLHTVLDHLPTMVCMKDVQGRYLLINHTWESLFQVTNAYVCGKTDFDLFPQEAAEQFHANDLAVITERMAAEFEEVLKVNGQTRTFLSLKFPLLGQDGAPYAICGISTDITDSRRRDEEMRLLRRQIWHADRVTRTGAITASLAHEISQPLAAILSNAQAGLRFLDREEPDLDEVRELLQDIARDSKRAGGVVNGLRTLLKQQETQREHIDLRHSIEEVLELLHSEFIMRGVEVRSDLQAGCTLWADKVQIQQLMLNLMMNALESMAENSVERPQLNISVVLENASTAHVSLRDNGIGIPPEMLDAVFDGFVTTKAQGLGIGLAVCRHIVESHGGTIRIENNADHGVTFHITLPIDSRVQPLAPIAKPRHPKLHALTLSRRKS